MLLRSRPTRALCALAILSICSTLRAADHTFEIDTTDFKPQPKTINVAGDFNGWSTSASPMKLAADHKWSVTVKGIEEGTHYYKFVVDAGAPEQKWINDPKADKSLEVSDGNGGNNSGVVVGADVAKLPPPKPNAINFDAVLYEPSDGDFEPINSEFARVRVRTQVDDVQAVGMRISPFDDEPVPGASVITSRLRHLGTEGGLDVWGGLVPIPKATEVIPSALLQDGSMSSVKYDMGPGIATKSLITVPAWTADANWYQIFVERFRNGDPSNDPGDFKAYENLIAWNADWFKTQPGEVPGDENFFHGAGNVWKRRFGGDLAGVREKLPYLRSLGINAIYLNPIFEAESMHKYDTADYRHVDDNFGVRDEATKRRSDEATEGGADINPSSSPSSLRRSVASSLGNKELFNLDGSPVAADYKETEDPATWKWTKSDLLFLAVLKDAHAQGFHLIIDGVFNHVGRANVFFQDVLKNGKRSKYADWFDITDWGDEKNWHEMADPFKVHGMPGGIQWTAWDGKNKFLPNWKKDAKLGIAHGPREHILAIAQRWGNPDGDPKTNDGIDGWRLDAAEQVPHPFWESFRTAVRAANPESYIDGEIWNPAQPWVNDGKEFDAVMNYQFAMAAQAFFVDNAKQSKVSDFNNRLVKIWFMYPQASALAMQNLFDSHDTDRLASMFVNPDRPYDGENRPQDNAAGKKYDMRAPSDEEWQRLLQAVAFQQCFIGAPMTYYGDEAGMWGADDPSDRQPYPWEDKGPYAGGVGVNKKIFDGFQRFIAIRNALPALREGTFYPVAIDDSQNVYAFARELGDQRVYVAMNRSNEARTIKLNGLTSGSYVDYCDPAQVTVEMKDGATERPTVKVKPDAKTMTPTAGALTVTLPPHGRAILAAR